MTTNHDEELREKISKILLDPGNHVGYMHTGVDGLTHVRLTSDILKKNLNMPMLEQDILDLIHKERVSFAVKELEKLNEKVVSSPDLYFALPHTELLEAITNLTKEV
jgi:hypothetical protein